MKVFRKDVSTKGTKFRKKITIKNKLRFSRFSVSLICKSQYHIITQGTGLGRKGRRIHMLIGTYAPRTHGETEKMFQKILIFDE